MECNHEVWIRKSDDELECLECGEVKPSVSPVAAARRILSKSVAAAIIAAGIIIVFIYGLFLAVIN